jgi:hypothetical protein
MKAAMGAVMMIVWMLPGTASAVEPDPAAGDAKVVTREGRGFVAGLGFGPGQTGFGDADRLALFVGAATSTEGSCVASSCIVTQVRSGRVAPRGSTLPGTRRVVPFPRRQDAGSISMLLGWSFSPSLAVLGDADMALGWADERFDHLVLGVVVRYSPASRVWLQAGPAFGQLEYRYGINSFEQGITDTAARVEGGGVLAAAGYEILRKPTWRLDAQARAGMVWYEQLRATNISVQLGIHRRRS